MFNAPCLLGWLPHPSSMEKKVLKIDSMEILPTLRMLLNLHVSSAQFTTLIELVSAI